MSNSLLSYFDQLPEKSKFAPFTSCQFYTFSKEMVCNGKGVAFDLFKTLKV